MTMKLSPHQLVPINAENIRALAPLYYYSDKQMRRLLGDGCTALEVATLRGGKWAKFSDYDRIYLMCLKGVMTSKSQRLFAVDCARRALQRVRDSGGKVHADSWKACDVAEQYANGQATDQELAIARSAAWSVTFSSTVNSSAAAEAAAEAAWQATGSEWRSMSGAADEAAAGQGPCATYRSELHGAIRRCVPVD